MTVNTLSLGKPEKGKLVEEMLLRMAQSGQLAGKLGEKELINLLESLNQQTQKTTTVKVSAIYVQLLIWNMSDDESKTLRFIF